MVVAAAATIPDVAGDPASVRTTLLHVGGFSRIANFHTDSGGPAAGVDTHDVPIVPAAVVIPDVHSVPSDIGLCACCC